MKPLFSEGTGWEGVWEVEHMNAAKSKLFAMSTKKPNASKQKRKRGATKMREAADKVVGRDCKPIIEALSSNSKKGQMLSAKFLYNLAQLAESSSEGEGIRKFRSMAMEIANSPEWSGESAAEPGEDDVDES